MNYAEQLDKIRRLAAELSEIFPQGHSVELNVRRYGGNLAINIHGCKSYDEATEIFRRFGVGKRHKTPYADELGVRSVVQGKLAPDLSMTVFCEGLPPSCRLETFTERVPKTQTVESGEFIEIERTRVVCGNQEPAQESQAA